MILILIPKISCLSYCYNEYIRVIACTLFTPEIPKTYVWENYSIFGISDWKQLIISDCTLLKQLNSQAILFTFETCLFVCSLLTATDCYENTMSYYSIAEEESFHCSAYVSSNECKHTDMPILADGKFFIAEGIIRFCVNVRTLIHWIQWTSAVASRHTSAYTLAKHDPEYLLLAYSLQWLCQFTWVITNFSVFVIFRCLIHKSRYIISLNYAFCVLPRFWISSHQ